jgi:hypothetical protein
MSVVIWRHFREETAAQADQVTRKDNQISLLLAQLNIRYVAIDSNGKYFGTPAEKRCVEFIGLWNNPQCNFDV